MTSADEQFLNNASYHCRVSHVIPVTDPFPVIDYDRSIVLCFVPVDSAKRSQSITAYNKLLEINAHGDVVRDHSLNALDKSTRFINETYNITCWIDDYKIKEDYYGKPYSDSDYTRVILLTFDSPESLTLLSLIHQFDRVTIGEMGAKRGDI